MLTVGAGETVTTKKKPTNNVAATQSAAQLLGSRGGLANTRAQNRARARNAKLAGRPRRICAVCHEPVRGGHFDPERDETCGKHGWRWQKADGAGRPRRVCRLCGEPVRGGHVDRELDDTCGIHGWRWQSPADRRK